MSQTQCPTCGQELPTESNTFGSRIEAARVQREMTRQDLADALGYERTSIVTRWETGQLEPTEISVVESVALALDVTPAWLLYGVQEPKLFTDVADALVEYYQDEVDGEPVLVEDEYEPTEPPAKESPAEIVARIRAAKAAASEA